MSDLEDPGPVPSALEALRNGDVAAMRAWLMHPYVGAGGMMNKIAIYLSDKVASQEAEVAQLRTRAIMAEQHKVLSLLGKSSYQEQVEEQLRVQLAESQVKVGELEAELSAVRQELAEAKALYEANHG